jgi:hypothetical protein
MSEILRFAAVVAAGVLAVLIFSVAQAVIGNRGRFSLSKLFFLMTLAAAFIFALKMAIELSHRTN